MSSATPISAVDVKKINAAISRADQADIPGQPRTTPPGTLIPPRRHPGDSWIPACPFVLDEAYYEFSGETVVPLVGQYPNLMVLRVSSKWAGLAGLRVGYGIFPPRIAGYLLAIKIPYNVNMAGEIAVRESLADMDYLQGRVKAIIAERDRLFAELEDNRLAEAVPVAGQLHLSVPCSKGSASELHRKLQQKGILVRYFDRPLLKNSIRISVGRPEHTDALMKALREIRSF